MSDLCYFIFPCIKTVFLTYLLNSCFEALMLKCNKSYVADISAVPYLLLKWQFRVFLRLDVYPTLDINPIFIYRICSLLLPVWHLQKHGWCCLSVFDVWTIGQSSMKHINTYTILIL